MPRAVKATPVVRVSAGEVEARRIVSLLAEMLDSYGIAAAASESKRGWDVEIHFVRAPERKFVRALVRTAAGKEVAARLKFASVGPKDWLGENRTAFAPVRVGRFAVHGGHDRAAIAPNELGIEIEAALAFGTGHHGTTQGCLAAIGRIARARHPRRILDLGTGTGVLAIAAARALRAPVVAGDIDPVAVETARANVRDNHAAAFVRVVQAAGVNAPTIRASAPYDLVLANILLGPLTRLARPVTGLLARHAIVVLSGLLPEQANATLAAWRSQGLRLVRRDLVDGWVTLMVARP